jgi:hypothetical protein
MATVLGMVTGIGGGMVRETWADTMGQWGKRH